MARTPKTAAKSITNCALKADDITFIRKIVKEQILDPGCNPFRGSEKECADVLYLFRRAMEHGESNSALLIGPRGSGKSAVRANFLISFAEFSMAHLTYAAFFFSWLKLSFSHSRKIAKLSMILLLCALMAMCIQMIDLL